MISNTANATSTTGDPVPANNSATTTTTVATSADVSVTKVDTPDPVVAGANLTYTITITNAGPSAAANATLNDTLPAGATFVSLAEPAGWGCTTPAVGTGGTVTCSIASLAPGNAVVARAGEIVVVTSVLAPATVDTLLHVASQRRVSVVWVDAPSFVSRPTRADPGALRVSAAGVPIAVVRRGEDLGLALGARLCSKPATERGTCSD